MNLFTEMPPGRIAWGAFRNEYGNDVHVPEASEPMAIPQHLTETEAKLPLFVLVSDALDLSNEDNTISLPGEIEVRLMRQARARFDACIARRCCSAEV